MRRSSPDEDAPVEWPDEAFERAQISVGGKVVREASGTFTRRGRPPVAGEAKHQVTLRLAPEVVRYFKGTGRGWQTRLNAVLERHVSQTGKKVGMAASQRPDKKSSFRGVEGVRALDEERE